MCLVPLVIRAYNDALCLPIDISNMCSLTEITVTAHVASGARYAAIYYDKLERSDETVRKWGCPRGEAESVLGDYPNRDLWALW